MKILDSLPLLVLAAGLGLARPGAAPVAAQDPLQPGPEHARLQRLVGTWDTVLVTRDPSGAEQRTRGRATFVPHTAFHTVESFEGELMGLQLVGHGVNGYCPVRKKYFTLWTDSMTPSPLLLYGDWDEEKQELSLSGECFGMSGKLEPCRTVTRHLDDDHFAWALFGAGPDGKEVQHLALEYTRRD